MDKGTPAWCPLRPKRKLSDKREVRPAVTQEQKVALWKDLIASCNIANELEGKTNSELADLLLNHVWADKNIVSAQSALIEEVIQRLRKEKTE
jgi:hypothetical protein